MRFTVPVFSKHVLMFSIEEYPNNIRSSDFALSFVNASSTFHHGAMRLTCRFEENGNEIAGTFQAHLRNMSLSLTVGLAMEGEAISYDSAEAKLDFDLDIVGVPDSLLNPVFGYTDKLRHQIEQDLATMVTRPEIKSRISRAATEKILKVLPAGANIYTVKVSRDAVFVKYWQ